MRWVRSRDEPVGVLADAAAEDEEVRPHQRVDRVQVLVEVRRPGLPGQPASGPRGRGRSPFRGSPADLHLPELGVRDEHAVDEHARADAGPEGQEDDDARLVLAHPEAHLGDPRRVGVVDDRDRRVRATLPSRSTTGKSTQPGVDVGRGLDLALDRDAGQPDADRHASRRVAPALASRFTSRPIEAMTASGVDGDRRRDPQALGDELPRVDVDDGGLDPAAADVDADREPSGWPRSHPRSSSFGQK